MLDLGMAVRPRPLFERLLTIMSVSWLANSATHWWRLCSYENRALEMKRTSPSSFPRRGLEKKRERVRCATQGIEPVHCFWYAVDGDGWSRMLLELFSKRWFCPSVHVLLNWYLGDCVGFGDIEIARF